jgi:hypothetical protein
MGFLDLKKPWKKLACVGLIAVAVPAPARAEYCYSEKITALITDGSYVQFTTDKSCSSWCRINTGWSQAATDRAYSQLALAIGAGKLVTFFWTGTATGCPTVPVYTAPELLWVSP